MIRVDVLRGETLTPTRGGKRSMVCNKMWFSTEGRALGYRNHIRHILGRDQRQYYCKKCLGWHLTSRLLPWQIKNAKAMGYNV